MKLEGKVVVVTGGGQGLGLCIAKFLAAKGSRLALIDINKDILDSAAKIIESEGGIARAYQANVADEEQVIDVFNQIIADFGEIHGLVNNAGILRDGLLVKAKDGKVVKKLSLAAWQSVIDVNLTGVFLCAREAAEKMIDGGNEGVIINISSISRAGNAGQTNYTAAKAGVAGMTVTWARELARYGIRSAAIAPGFINTEMVASMKPEMREKLTAPIPLGRLGFPEEIAQTAIFIMENDYVSGRVIEVDGALRL